MVRSRPIKRCKTGCMDYAMPSPPTVAYKALSAALVLSAPFSYLSTSSLLFCHSSRSTPSARLLGFLQDIPLRYLGISPYLSLLFPLCMVSYLSCLYCIIGVCTCSYILRTRTYSAVQRISLTIIIDGDASCKNLFQHFTSEERTAQGYSIVSI